jgi:UDP-N-acetylglucosamine 2-epimerase (non-hydrolysing)
VTDDTKDRTVVFVAGARPNFMKVAPLLRALRARPGRLAGRLVHTGQHYDPSMSSVFFRDLDIPEPDAHLEVGSGLHGAQTARILSGFEEYLLAHPATQGVVVVGDVNSTVAGALAAVKLGIPVAHVEAGLRSFDRSMPEEINRVVTDAISDLLLVSEPSGEENLRREGISEDRIRSVGNVMIDSVVRELPAARRLHMRDALGLEGPFVLVTLHRPSNVDDLAKMTRACASLERVAARLPVVFPVHPRTGKQLREFGLFDRLASTRGMRCLPPLGYHEALGVMSDAAVVITDSGGIQEETSYLRVPCLTMRETTERPVTVTLGTNSVVGHDWDRAEALVTEVLEGRYKKGADIPLWDGHAAERVAEVLLAAWGE